MSKQPPLIPNCWTAWTDGSLKDGRFGGWGAVVRSSEGEEFVFSGNEAGSTNNRMELTAAIRAIEFTPPESQVLVVSDSKYVVDGAESWLPKWVRNSWKGSMGVIVANVDLWKQLHSLLRTREVAFSWVRGHDGHEFNERADKLATRAARRLQNRGNYG